MRALVVLAALAVLALVPAAAHAAGDQESTFQDDSLLVYGSPSEQSLALDMMKGLGVDRVRVSVIWKLVAPDSDSSTKPKFDATDPNAYPNGAWDRYDTLVRLAEAKGIGVNLDLVDPAPLWATSNPPRADVATVSNPDPAEFGEFVQAVGARYSGLLHAPGAGRSDAAAGPEPGAPAVPGHRRSGPRPRARRRPRRPGGHRAAAARGLLVALERAQPGRLAGAAVAGRAAGLAAPVPRARRRCLDRACGHRPPVRRDPDRRDRAEGRGRADRARRR